MCSKSHGFGRSCFIQSVWKAKLRELQQANTELADLEEDHFMRIFWMFAFVCFWIIILLFFSCHYKCAFLAFVFGIAVTFGLKNLSDVVFLKDLMWHILNSKHHGWWFDHVHSQGMDCNRCRFWFILQLMDSLTSQWGRWNAAELDKNSCELYIGCLS